jgi:hypothetical protein
MFRAAELLPGLAEVRRTWWPGTEAVVTQNDNKRILFGQSRTLVAPCDN